LVSATAGLFARTLDVTGTACCAVCMTSSLLCFMGGLMRCSGSLDI
jgi:hypothetical protein